MRCTEFYQAQQQRKNRVLEQRFVFIVYSRSGLSNNRCQAALFNNMQKFGGDATIAFDNLKDGLSVVLIAARHWLWREGELIHASLLLQLCV